MAKDRFRRSKWSRFLWDRETRRLSFYERHLGLRPVPYLIISALVVVLAVAIAFAYADPSAKLYGYAVSLVAIDLGMVFIAGLFAMAGHPLWREDRDSTYLALAIGFAGIPVWGLLEVLCVNGILMASIPAFCEFRTSAGWILGVWFVAVPAFSTLREFRRFVLRDRASQDVL